MSSIRDFTAQQGFVPPLRNVEDAPPGLRQELIDLVWQIGNLDPYRVYPDGHLYYVIEQSLGFQAAGNPMSGRRQTAGRDVADVDWPRVYDLIVRLWHEFWQVGLHDYYQSGVNRILAAYGTAWDLADDGRLHRVLPTAAQEQINAAIVELNIAEFAPALTLFNTARDAYDARPRRDRDACSNAFDAMESVAKARYGMPHATFGDVLTHLGRTAALNACIIAVLNAINQLRNRNFGHGMTTAFNPTPAEVDFIYLTCIGAILLFCRSR